MCIYISTYMMWNVISEAGLIQVLMASKVTRLSVADLAHSVSLFQSRAAFRVHQLKDFCIIRSKYQYGQLTGC